MDAAIAASAALSVIYPHMTGLGGDAFWLIYDAKQKRVRYLDGAGCAAASAAIESFRARGMDEIPFRGILPATLTVPGAVASWCEAHAAHGRLPLARNLAAAAGYAREGFPVTERLANWIAATAPELAQNQEAAAIFLKHGKAPRTGQTLVNADLARSIEAVGAGGREAFYGGEIAQELARYALANGGFFSAADFRAQHAQWREPIHTDYRGVRLYQTPPPTQGISVLQMLNLLEPYELGAMQYLGADHVHFLVQAKQLAYHDRDRWVADPAFADVPVERLLSRAYAGQRRALIDQSAARPVEGDRYTRPRPESAVLPGNPGDFTRECTTHLDVIDADGNCVSITQSIGAVFGSGFMAGDTGIMMNNFLYFLDYDPESPNAIRPGGQMLGPLSPTMLFRDGRLFLSIGTPGGFGITQTTMQMISNVVDHGFGVQAAIEAPRFKTLVNRQLVIEDRVPAETLDALRALGHEVVTVEEWSAAVGGGQGILVDPDTGAYSGGADPRRDGYAMGW